MQCLGAQVKPSMLASTSISGRQLQQRAIAAKAARPSMAVVRSSAADDEAERLRLFNLSPQQGSRKGANRKGRGYGAGQGGTAGFGMRGQKSRSGSGIRPGFEGGQTPLYRRLPKLKGIAGGMGAGLPDFVVVNLTQLAKFAEGEEVTLEALEAKRIVNLSGRETRLPLKVLGTGELTSKLTIKAAAFSASAKQKIEAAGGQAVELPQKATWTRKAHEARVAAAAAK
ncbi:50S ribosomal protein L15 [Chlorella vulgaris]